MFPLWYLGQNYQATTAVKQSSMFHTLLHFEAMEGVCFTNIFSRFEKKDK